MTKEQAQQHAARLLQDKLTIDNLLLREAIIADVVASIPDDEELADWEQFRAIKRRLDYIWQNVKKCSEQKVVTAKIEKMMASFPRPKAAREKGKK